MNSFLYKEITNRLNVIITKDKSGKKGPVINKNGIDINKIDKKFSNNLLWFNVIF